MSENQESIQESQYCDTLELWEYYGLVTTANENYQDAIKLALCGFESELPRGVAIVTVGSDGKLERHAQSMTELVVISEDSGTVTLRERLRNYCAKEIAEMDFDYAHDGLPGFYALDQQAPLSFVYGDPRLVYPDFLLNSRLLMGEFAIWNQARQRILEEMYDQEVGQKIRRTIRKQLTHQRQIMRNGGDVKVVHWNFDNGVQYYDEANNALGFKMGPIRAVQRKLDLLTIASLPQRAEDLPTPTLKRVACFSRLGKIDKDLGEAVSESYIWFLQRYHSIQEIYKDTRQPASLAFCQEDFTRHIAPVWEFIG